MKTLTKTAGRWSGTASIQGWPPRLYLRDVESASNPCNQIELQLDLDDIQDLMHILNRSLEFITTGA